MAVVQVNSGYNFYGPSTGNMASPNFSGWNYASIGLGGTTATLQPLGPQDFGSLTTMTLSGTNLSITPNVIVAAIYTGPDLGLRVATGTVQSLQYIAGASASHGSISTSYSISGLNVGFQTLLNNSAAPLAYLLSGNDEILGSNYHDILEGYAGNDVLRPGFANYYPSTYDVVDGGLGTDTISFSDISLGVTVNLTTGLATGGDPNIAPRVNAHLISIENATGGSGNDILIGSAIANVLSGGAGNDNLYGGVGNDTLLGGLGNDILRGDAGADIINGGDGIDRADYTTSTVGMNINLTNGTASDGDTLTGIENVYGSTSNDVIIGSGAANVLYGNTGDDQLFGLAGNDNLQGMIGNDALFGGDGNDVLIGGEGNDGLFGEAGNDTLYGGNGNDYLSGSDGNDVIWGDAGNDQIDAGTGNDFVVLGAGDDIFTLGAGDDRIRFDYGNGIDTIRDFGNGADILDFTATNMTLAALQANTVETSQGVLMNLGSGSILLEGLHLWQVDWTGDFAFAV